MFLGSEPWNWWGLEVKQKDRQVWQLRRTAELIPVATRKTVSSLRWWTSCYQCLFGLYPWGCRFWCWRDDFCYFLLRCLCRLFCRKAWLLHFWKVSRSWLSFGVSGAGKQQRFCFLGSILAGGLWKFTLVTVRTSFRLFLTSLHAPESLTSFLCSAML